MIVMEAACVAFILAGLAGVVAGLTQSRRFGRNGTVALVLGSAFFIGTFAFLLKVLVGIASQIAANAADQ